MMVGQKIRNSSRARKIPHAAAKNRPHEKGIFIPLKSHANAGALATCAKRGTMANQSPVVFANLESKSKASDRHCIRNSTPTQEMLPKEASYDSTVMVNSDREFTNDRSRSIYPAVVAT